MPVISLPKKDPVILATCLDERRGQKDIGYRTVRQRKSRCCLSPGLVHLGFAISTRSFSKSRARTKKEISLACGISEVTISKCYKKLTEYKKYLFSKELRKQYKI